MSVVEENDEGCWVFKADAPGCSIDSDGYGRWYDSERYAAGEQPLVYCHRWAYEHWKGAIPTKMVPDHMCHDPVVCKLGKKCPHRRCGNPDHLELKIPKENILRGGGPPADNARKTACDEGHLYINPDGSKNYRMRESSGRSWRICFDCYGPGLGQGSFNRLKEFCGSCSKPYSEENTYYDNKGYRHCKNCRRLRVREFYWRNKEKKNKDTED